MPLRLKSFHSSLKTSRLIIHLSSILSRNHWVSRRRSRKCYKKGVEHQQKAMKMHFQIISKI